MYRIYARVSTDEQDIESQIYNCVKFLIEKKGSDTQFETYKDEDVTSSLPMSKRPQLQKMLKDLRPGDCVIVAHSDRLSRDSVESILIRREIKSKRCGVYGLDGGDWTTEDSELATTIQGAVSQEEKRRISIRVKAYHNIKRSRNERISGFLPYGYSIDETKKVEIRRKGKKPEWKFAVLIENEEQNILNKIYQWFDEGHSYRAITQMLNQSGFTNRVGNRFSHNQIYRIVQRSGRSREDNSSQSPVQELLFG